LLDQLIEKSRLTYIDAALKQKDGRPVYVIQNLVGDFDADGNLTQVKGYMFNNTERKLLEQQLRQAQKMEAVGRLAGGVAHDFNNQLTAIMSYAGLALNKLSKDSPIRPDLEGILQSARSAANLIRQLLAFSRKQIVKPQNINFNSLISNLDKMLRRLISENIELITSLAPNLGQIKADPGQLEQVLVNLVVNARDAMPEGGKLLIETKNITLDQEYVRLHPQIPPGNYVQLSVSDTGIGMTPDVQTHLFEPFFTTKEKGKGTGLGLATCFGIIKQNGGQITAYSEVGVGTTVKVYLPAVDVAATIHHQPLSSSTLQYARRNETILIVEDDDTILNLGVSILSELGYTILKAQNGNEALQLVKKIPHPKIDLLITDVVMPKMGGKVLFARMKAIYPNIKILFMSGYTNETIGQADILEPGTPFLQKPFSPVTLSNKVRAVLSGQSATE